MDSSIKNTSKTFCITVSEDQHGVRLDKVLAQHPEVGSRTKAQFLIGGNLVRINDLFCKASQTLSIGDIICFDLPQPTASTIIPLALALDIHFEDDDLIVLNKPPGLVVHPGPGHGQDTLVNALAAHTKNLSMRFGEDRPGIVHRIDKDTSGLLVVAKNDKTHEGLVQQFQNRQVHRIYYAITIGAPKESTGRIISYISRHPIDRKRNASVRDSARKIIRDEQNSPPNGKIAITTFEFLQSQHNLGLVKLKLETGRTHQIRVHLSELGHPIVGDELYGAHKRISDIKNIEVRVEIRNLDRFLLHAAELGFYHPRSHEYLKFTVDWPEKDLKLIREKWGFR